MVTECVITLPIEPTEGEIVKSHPLFSFINIGQRGRMYSKPHKLTIPITLSTLCMLTTFPSPKLSSLPEKLL